MIKQIDYGILKTNNLVLNDTLYELKIIIRLQIDLIFKLISG